MGIRGDNVVFEILVFRKKCIKFAKCFEAKLISTYSSSALQIYPVIFQCDV